MLVGENLEDLKMLYKHNLYNLMLIWKRIEPYINVGREYWNSSNYYDYFEYQTNLMKADLWDNRVGG